MWIKSVVLFIYLLISSSLWAQEELQSHQSILKSAKEHLIRNIASRDSSAEITMGTLDRRLRLKQCEEPLETFSPPASAKIGNLTVGVKCSGEKPWSLYVQARVEIYDDVLVAQRNLARGEIIRREDLQQERMSLSRLTQGYLINFKDVLGKKVVRTIRAGKPISPQAITLPLLIRRGDKVVIIAKTRTIEVKMEGKALGSGTRGDTIRVENRASGVELEATVLGKGVVEVQM